MSTITYNDENAFLILEQWLQIIIKGTYVYIYLPKTTQKL